MVSRRRLLTGIIGAASGLFAARVSARQAEALRFPGDPTDHNVVYQLNKPDQDYHKAILFSVGELLRKYNDNVTIVVTVIGSGIHVLGKNPQRHVADDVKQKIHSLADYGVKFHACGNTLKSLGWDQKDLYDFVEIVPVGAIDLIELQEKGYSYISW